MHISKANDTAEFKSIEFNTTLKAQALTAWGYCYFMLYLIPVTMNMKETPPTHTQCPRIPLSGGHMIRTADPNYMLIPQVLFSHSQIHY